MGLVPGLGRSPGEGKGCPLQYSGLGIPWTVACIVHGVAKSWTWLSDFHFHFHHNRFPRWLSGKESPWPIYVADTGNTGSIPEWGRSPGKGNGNPLQYYCLENPHGQRSQWATVHGVEISQTQLSTHTPKLIMIIIATIYQASTMCQMLHLQTVPHSTLMEVMIILIFQMQKQLREFLPMFTQLIWGERERPPVCPAHDNSWHDLAVLVLVTLSWRLFEV